MGGMHWWPALQPNLDDQWGGLVFVDIYHIRSVPSMYMIFVVK